MVTTMVTTTMTTKMTTTIVTTMISFNNDVAGEEGAKEPIPNKDVNLHLEGESGM